MVKNTTGGNKTKKKKRTRVVDIYNTENDGQFFGKIVRNMGGHFGILGVDNIERIGKLRNAVKRGPRLNKDSFVIYSLREFSDKNECDVIGIANPPQNIIKQFETLDPKKKITNIEFNDSDDDDFCGIDKMDHVNTSNANDSYCNFDMMPLDNNDDEHKHIEMDESKYDECKNLMNDDVIGNIDFLDELDENEQQTIVNNDGEYEVDMIDNMMNLNDTHVNKHNKSAKKDKTKKDKELKDITKELDDIDFDNIDFDDI